uniref:ABC-type transport system, substrate-binding protein n=1 Tax=Candidatus Kentrum sp. FW TaxID=2126338 RepID=A0A450SPK3_9GAMM|nr:MAG: ABC-type transport system, substrate-binding protein [Candidatus Kentron sp. FW]
MYIKTLKGQWHTRHVATLSDYGIIGANSWSGRWFLAWLMALAVTLLSACSEPKTEGSQLTIGIESEPERLDPLTMKNPKTFILSWQIYEGLLGLDDSGEIAPKLAERWESQDFRTWTFHLRDDVSFHASNLFGAPDKTRRVTVDDVLWSYTAYCSPSAYSSFLLTDSVQGCAEYNAGKADSVTGLKVMDEHTFQITLLKPEPFFLNRLTTAWIAVFPKEAHTAPFKETWGLQTAVGTGPYRLQSRTDSEIILARNSNYWDRSRSPKIEKLVYRVLKNDQIRLVELKKGNVDLMVVPNALFPAVLNDDGKLKGEYAENFRAATYETFNTHMLGINLNAITDVHLRRAMYYGTDRRAIVDKLLYGYADVTGGTIPPGIRGYTPPFEATALYNPTLAKEELARSSYRGKEIELLVHDLANSEQIGQIFQSQMKALGINIRLTKMDYNSVIGRVVKGDAPMFGMFFEYVLSSPEPILLNLFTSAKRPVPNFWQYSNPDVDEKIEALRTIHDSTEANRHSAEIEEEIMREVPAIFLYREKYLAMYSRKFTNLIVNGHGHFRFEHVKTSQ